MASEDCTPLGSVEEAAELDVCSESVSLSELLLE